MYKKILNETGLYKKDVWKKHINVLEKERVKKTKKIGKNLMERNVNVKLEKKEIIEREIIEILELEEVFEKIRGRSKDLSWERTVMKKIIQDIRTTFYVNSIIFSWCWIDDQNFLWFLLSHASQ